MLLGCSWSQKTFLAFLFFHKNLDDLILLAASLFCLYWYSLWPKAFRTSPMSVSRPNLLIRDPLDSQLRLICVTSHIQGCYRSFRRPIKIFGKNSNHFGNICIWAFARFSNLQAKCPIPGNVFPGFCCQVFGVVSNLALCASYGCVYCLWLNIDRKKWPPREPNTWPPGSSEPGRKHGCRRTCAHTHWQKPVLLDRL